jgi:hypothetical protein
MKARVAVGVDTSGTVVTCGVSGKIDDELALSRVRSKTMGALIALCVCDVEIPEIEGKVEQNGKSN